MRKRESMDAHIIIFCTCVCEMLVQYNIKRSLCNPMVSPLVFSAKTGNLLSRDLYNCSLLLMTV